MERRTLIALALSFAVLGLYPVVLEKIYPDYYKKQAIAKKNAEAAKKAGTSVGEIGANKSPDAGSFDSDKDLQYNSSLLNMTFNGSAAAIHQAAFPEFAHRKTGKPLSFISRTEIKGAPLLLAINGKPIENFYSTQDGGNLVSRSEADGFRIIKVLELSPGRYDGKLRVSIENISGKDQALEYRVYAGSSVLPRNSIDQQYIETNFFEHSENKIQHLKDGKKIIHSKGAVDWVALKDRHFSLILKPEGNDGFHGLHEGLGNHRFAASLVSPNQILPASGKISQDFQFYLGPNDFKILEPIGLGAIVNFGKLDTIGKFLVGGLELAAKIFKNYGVAIIVLTMAINVCLFPMTRISYMSMKRMQLMQPQVKKLQEQYKNNKEKLNQATMELYKKHKVNPFGGCLPMLLQMPIFIALYVALSKAVILVNSKFLWIDDLSSPDIVPLPFTLPFIGNSIHLLPIIMITCMAIQQRFTQVKMEGQDPMIEQQQKMMSFMMPVIFGFIFYSMPAALVLYWLTNTIVMTLYQLSLKRMTLT